VTATETRFTQYYFRIQFHNCSKRVKVSTSHYFNSLLPSTAVRTTPVPLQLHCELAEKYFFFVCFRGLIFKSDLPPLSNSLRGHTSPTDSRNKQQKSRTFFSPPFKRRFHRTDLQYGNYCLMMQSDGCPIVSCYLREGVFTPFPTISFVPAWIYIWPLRKPVVRLNSRESVLSQISLALAPSGFWTSLIYIFHWLTAGICKQGLKKNKKIAIDSKSSALQLGKEKKNPILNFSV